MSQEDILEEAATMFLDGARRKEVLQFLNQCDIKGEEADKIATKAYLSVKEERMHMINQMPDYAEDEFSKLDMQQEENGSNGIAGLVVGGAILLIGLVLSFSSDRVLIGVIVIGAVTMASGIGKMFR